MRRQATNQSRRSATLSPLVRSTSGLRSAKGSWGVGRGRRSTHAPMWKCGRWLGIEEEGQHEHVARRPGLFSHTALRLLTFCSQKVCPCKGGPVQCRRGQEGLLPGQPRGDVV